VDLPIFEAHVKPQKKAVIQHNAATVAELLGPFMMVRHTAETGRDITDLEEASYRTGVYEAVAPYRQLFVLQIIRYWVELLYALEHLARNATRNEDIPFFGEIFARFYNPDSYFKTRKTWERL
jgi:hypothetical protein